MISKSEEFDLQQTVADAFAERFGERPSFIVQAPGRVNIIGEHTDYNDGFVLPMAINRGMWIAGRPRSDRTVSLYSLDYDTAASFNIDSMEKERGWIEYVKGVAWALQDAGHSLNGWEGVMTGNVPRGSGLSSSAALELATAQAFQVVSGFEWDAAQMALLSQRAENVWVGVNCGIMDQMISAAGAAGHALLIDCRSLASQIVPLPPAPDGAQTAVVILDTATRRGLVDSAYNERRQQCEAAAAYFNIKALRDVSLADFLQGADGLDDLTRRRAQHVISENVRTLNAAKAMQTGDAQLLGQLMNESHASLRHDFEVTNDALNSIVDIAQAQPGCYGARMTGAGFGGCAVALVHAAHVDDFVTAVVAQYQSDTNLTPSVYICQPSQGASQLV